MIHRHATTALSAALCLAANAHAHAATIFAEDFTTLDPAFNTPAPTNGAARTIAAGTMTTSLPNTSTTGSAEINRAFDNSATNYDAFTATFDVDFTGLAFNPDGVNGVNRTSLYRLDPNNGNRPLTLVQLFADDNTDQYKLRVDITGIQFGGPADFDEITIPIATLQAATNAQFSIQTTVVPNGGLNWSIIADVTVNLPTTGTTLNASVTGNANNTNFNPITGINSVRLGTFDTTVDNQASNAELAGDVVFDNFTLTGTVIPEPGQASLLLLATATLRRRRR